MTDACVTGIECDLTRVFLAYLLQIQFAPQHLVRLLQIIVEASCDLAVRQVASITFKNFIAKHWAPHEAGKFSKWGKSLNYCFVSCQVYLFGFRLLVYMEIVKGRVLWS